MRILYLEAFYGGSHRAVADALIARSSHRIELETLPPHNWKWRMRDAALTFLERVKTWEEFDLIVCGGMLTVADLLAGLPRKKPLLLYAHETQLTYPTPDRTNDLHLGFTDVTNIAAATHTAFNSHSHRNAFLEQATELLRRMPRPRPRNLTRDLSSRSSVCHPGIDERFTANGRNHSAQPKQCPLIVWNHRWEFDKDPDSFFRVLREIKRRGHRFKLALLGENFQVCPKAFVQAQQEFAEQLVACGYAESRESYAEWLLRADIVISTAIQENFGLSVMEAMASGCITLLPHRLSYPEIVPQRYHEQTLYNSEIELISKLEQTIRDFGEHPTRIAELQRALAQHAERFTWGNRIGAFDALFTSLFEDGR